MLKENKKYRKGFQFLFIALLSLSVSLAHSNEFNGGQSHPAISIIIDDMGNHFKSGHRAVNLAGDLTYSFLPHSPHVKALSKIVHEQSKEVMLH